MMDISIGQLIIQGSILAVPAVVWFACVIGYHRWFPGWRNTVQGRALMTAFTAVAVLFTVNALVRILAAFGASLPIVIGTVLEVGVFLFVSAAGVMIFRSMRKAKKRNDAN